MQVGKLKKGMQKFLKMADIFPRNLEMFTFWSCTILTMINNNTKVGKRNERETKSKGIRLYSCFNCHAG